jgi:hypothetical protein
MSLHRRAAKRDANEADVIRALEQFGWQVMQISAKGAPDLIACHRATQTMLLAEVKAAKGKLTQDQIDWHAWWKGPPPVILRTVEDVRQLTISTAKGLVGYAQAQTEAR